MHYPTVTDVTQRADATHEPEHYGHNAWRGAWMCASCVAVNNNGARNCSHCGHTR